MQLCNRNQCTVRLYPVEIQSKRRRCSHHIYATTAGCALCAPNAPHATACRGLSRTAASVNYIADDEDRVCGPANSIH